MKLLKNMNKILFTLSIICLFSLSAFAQTESTKTDTPSPKVDPTTKYSELSEAEKNILGDYLLARTSMALCGALPSGSGCKENGDYQQKFNDALSAVIRSPKLTAYIVSNAARSYEGNKLSARSAPQISQVAAEQDAELIRVLVMQNQRIIELLEQIAKKK